MRAYPLHYNDKLGQMVQNHYPLLISCVYLINQLSNRTYMKMIGNLKTHQPSGTQSSLSLHGEEENVWKLLCSCYRCKPHFKKN